MVYQSIFIFQPIESYHVRSTINSVYNHKNICYFIAASSEHKCCWPSSERRNLLWLHSYFFLIYSFLNSRQIYRLRYYKVSILNVNYISCSLRSIITYKLLILLELIYVVVYLASFDVFLLMYINKKYKYDFVDFYENRWYHVLTASFSISATAARLFKRTVIYQRSLRVITSCCYSVRFGDVNREHGWYAFFAKYMKSYMYVLFM